MIPRPLELAVVMVPMGWQAGLVLGAVLVDRCEHRHPSTATAWACADTLRDHYRTQP